MGEAREQVTMDWEVEKTPQRKWREREKGYVWKFVIGFG